jgi:hypothetical protein
MDNSLGRKLKPLCTLCGETCQLVTLPSDQDPHETKLAWLIWVSSCCGAAVEE